MDKIKAYWNTVSAMFGPRVTIAIAVGGAVAIAMLIAAAVGA
jgi:hypothetical protein